MKRRLRDPERTRERLLQAAFREIHRTGFQSASIDAILAATNVTKGALYYHFDSKEAMGYAVVEEKIAKLTRDRWLRPMLSQGESIEILIGVVRRIPARPQDVRAGCPLLLLSQEMSPLDEQFRKRLAKIFLDWQKGVATLLRKGQSQGTVRRDLNPDQTAGFLIATVEGYATLAKNAQDANVWKTGIRNIVAWLKSLRVPGTASTAARGQHRDRTKRFGQHHPKGEKTMTSIAMSRRNLLAVGACALAATVSLPGLASANSSSEQNSANERVVRKWYAAWEQKDWGPVDRLLADSFTFTSAAGDDHINKSTFKTRCWETQINFIEHFDLEQVATGAEDAFVKYLCHTKNGKTFRNVEYLRIKNGQLESIECYFGAESSFPSAVSSGQK